ncbi:MAG: hypothetical protein PHV32_13815 [Eubacteriales bacterium]|nr:hypothetical protein [Paludibacter sp.]MDD4297012.1 hypothetical protein [Ruminiclostridium sp.]MDD4495394.1 hypothetical protein [Eubacteriales bacterium]
MDFIIIHGSPGNGKTTVASALHEKFGMPWFEFGWIPEFTKLNPHTNTTQEKEEQLSFENLVLVCKNYKKHGYQNITLTDLNDVRMLNIPVVFRNYDYVIITLYSEDDNIIKDRIINRNNGNDFKNYEESIETNKKIKTRKLLPNEYRIRSDNQLPIDIANEIIRIIESHKRTNDFNINDYNMDDYFSYINGYSFE